MAKFWRAPRLSIGDGEAVTNLVFHWSIDAERIWPGIFYVGSSRAKDTKNLVLQNEFTEKCASKIGRDVRWIAQHEEVQRIHAKADAQFAMYDDDGTRFKEAMRWLILYMREMHTRVSSDHGRAVLTCMAQWEASLLAL